ncbi:right-handed parallel beta-helix repeat-containing protein [Metasolibacillus sp.]|uniref:right-handed parallel beta-helix repeat-containing protein n=1 Tax=Metasolibacillus sp. TaxID=2703680 RepID=UPI0025D515FD|nr:right-handed parallel beta-helix repeat-containing protein [Metasolibacillus sp.]MCT6922881.1 right-handed parallel beta-helix repeat-containing protein [Metasolibacillus sp.]MCT6939119.1 right-handed parallel beta-helix repeat-containing protein [Metasolibacillus sp.]
MLHKVSASKFSFYQTLSTALKRAQHNDCLQLMPGQYHMPLFFQQSLRLKGKKATITGSITVPKGVIVHFEHITFQQNSQILIEGTALFHQCHFIETETITANCGQLKMTACTITNAPISITNNSDAMLNNCHFSTCHTSSIIITHAQIELVDCHFEDALHAVVLKEHAKANIIQCHFTKQRHIQLLVQNNSELFIRDSTIENGYTSALRGEMHCRIKLQNTLIQHHLMTQIILQCCALHIEKCKIQHGRKCGLQLVQYAEATIDQCYFLQNHDAHIDSAIQCALFMTNSTLHGPTKIGIQLQEKSVAHFSNTIFKHQQEIQLLLSESAYASIEQCTFCTGQQGIVVQQRSYCTLLDSTVSNHQQAAIAIYDSEFIALNNQIIRNNGYGLTAQHEAAVMLENNRFSDNELSHIMATEKTNITIHKSKFIRGKGMYIADSSLLYMTESAIYDGNDAQITGNNSTKIYIVESKLYNGRCESIKASNNCFIHIMRSTISAHPLQQIVMNHSSLVLLDSLVEKGLQNAIALSNYCDARIEKCQILQHRDTQLIATLYSAITLLNTQLTGGHTVNVDISHHSKATIEHCTFTNNKQAPNAQATQFSEMSIEQSTMNNYLQIDEKKERGC